MHSNKFRHSLHRCSMCEKSNDAMRFTWFTWNSTTKSIVSSIRRKFKNEIRPFFMRIFPHSILNDAQFHSLADTSAARMPWMFSSSFSLHFTKKKFHLKNRTTNNLLHTVFSGMFCALRAYMQSLLFFFGVSTESIDFVLLLFFVYIPCFYYEFNDFITSSQHSCVFVCVYDWDAWWYNMHGNPMQINLCGCCSNQNDKLYLAEQ